MMLKLAHRLRRRPFNGATAYKPYFDSRRHMYRRQNVMYAVHLFKGTTEMTFYKSLANQRHIVSEKYRNQKAYRLYMSVFAKI